MKEELYSKWLSNPDNIQALRGFMQAPCFQLFKDILSAQVTPATPPTFAVTGNVTTLEYNALKGAELAGAQSVIEKILELAETPKLSPSDKKQKPWEHLRK